MYHTLPPLTVIIDQHCPPRPFISSGKSLPYGFRVLIAVVVDYRLLDLHFLFLVSSLYGNSVSRKANFYCKEPLRVATARMNKMAGTPLGEMADQTIVGSVHNSDHEAFASGASCGGSLKASNSSPLVSPTAIINMSQSQFNVDVATTFRVSLTNVADNSNADVISCKVLHVDDSTIIDALVAENLKVDESPIVQSVSIQD
ncbi:hypothetical protein Tco_1105336 [Tanacetum coccineum]